MTTTVQMQFLAAAEAPPEVVPQWTDYDGTTEDIAQVVTGWVGYGAEWWDVFSPSYIHATWVGATISIYDDGSGFSEPPAPWLIEQIDLAPKAILLSEPVPLFFRWKIVTTLPEYGMVAPDPTTGIAQIYRISPSTVINGATIPYSAISNSSNDWAVVDLSSLGGWFDVLTIGARMGSIG